MAKLFDTPSIDSSLKIPILLTLAPLSAAKSAIAALLEVSYSFRAWGNRAILCPNICLNSGFLLVGEIQADED